MHILIFTQSFPNRRYPIDSEFLIPMAATWAQMGHRVRVLTVQYSDQDPLFEEREGFEVTRFPFSRLRYEEQRGKLDSLRYMIEFLIKGWVHLHRQIQTFRPDVIDFEFVVPSALLSVPLHGRMRRHNIRKLVRICGSDYRVPRSVPWLGRLTLKFVLRDFDTIHFATADLIEMAQSDGFPPGKLALNFPGVPIDLYTPDTALRRSRQAELGLVDKFVLLTVGRCIALKEQHLIIRALPQLRKRISNLHFVLVGDGPELPNLRRLSTELDVDDVVTFMGAVDHARLNAVYNIGDVFVAPHYGEWFASLTIFEAASCGLPIVANYKPQYLEPYGLRDGTHLLRFAEGDVTDLARQILQIYENPETTRQMAEALMTHVRFRFNVSQMAQTYLEAAK